MPLDSTDALMQAIIDAFEAHTAMNTQALGSERVREGLKDILLGPAQLYETLQARPGMPRLRTGSSSRVHSDEDDPNDGMSAHVDTFWVHRRSS